MEFYMCDVDHWNLDTSLKTKKWAEKRDDFELLISICRNDILNVYVEATEEAIKEYCETFPFVTGYKVKENVNLKM